MKKLTKIFLIILTTLTLGVGISNVKAYNVGDKVTVGFERGYRQEAGIGYYTKDDLSSYDVRWAYQMFNYKIDNKYMAYCLDATYDDSVGSSNKVSGVYDPNNSAYNAGLYAIIENGANTLNSSNADKASTEIALRAFVEGVAMDGWTGGFKDQSYQIKFAANANIAIFNVLGGYSADDIKKLLESFSNTKLVYNSISECKTLNNSNEIETCYRKIAYNANHYDNYRKYAAYPTNSENFNKNLRARFFNMNSIREKAEQLLKKGIEAVLNFQKGEGNAIDDFKVDVKLASTTKPENNTEIKTFTFNLTGIKEYNKLNNVNVVCEKCNANNVKIESIEYKNGENWVKLTPDVDLTKLVDGNGNVTVRVTITKGEINSENCEPVSMKLTYDTYAKKGMELYKIQSTTNSWNTQRYVAVKLVSGNNDSNTAEKSENSTATYSIETNCKKETCETNLTTPICSEDENGIAKVEAPKDIKKCVIDNVDDATNEYRLADTNGGVNNDYCGTFCKEDYREISLNKALNNVNCGGYFKLQARIEGSKDCYRGSENTSDNAIDIEKYNNNIIDIQKSYIENHDTVLMTDEAAKNTSSIESECDEYGNLKDKDGNQLKTEENCTKHTWTLSGTYSGVEVANTNTTTGSVTSKTKSGTYTYTSTTSAEDISTQISDDASEAKENLEKLDEKYENTIKQFNACTKDWNSKYNFDPKVYWEYSQNFGEELDSLYNDLLSKEDRTLEPIESTRKDSDSLQACTGTTDKEINECSTGWTSTDSVFVDRTYIKCDEDECTTDTQKVSQAKFIKQHFEVEQDYDTPTVYYQVVSSGPSSGSIVTYKQYPSPNIPLSPVNVLPLAGDTTGGGIFKLKIEDLGEFYESGEQGRLIDFEGDHETHSVAYAKGYTADNNWSGEYVCHYYTDCRPKDCPDCKFVCVGEYCEWEDCPDCTFDCINCIYNLGDLQLNMKPVSTSKFNESAGREYGYNWNINMNLSKFPELTMVYDKADETIKEIEENNTTIYDDTNRDSDDSKLEFSIEMTPEIIENIRQYNKEKDGVGGYNDASLVCYDYEDENGTVHKNVFCYSTFIDNVIEKYGSNVYYKASRGTASDRSNESVVNSGYWTPWSEYGKYGESVIGGPSWK